MYLPFTHNINTSRRPVARLLNLLPTSQTLIIPSPSSNTANMVNYLTSVALLLTVATSTLAVPQGLEARAPSCLDNLPGDTLANVHMIQQPFIITQTVPLTPAQINEAVECINYLASLGNQACTAGVSGQSFCRRGNTQITGLAVGLPSDRTATSPW
jgi:hypothetical protein